MTHETSLPAAIGRLLAIAALGPEDVIVLSCPELLSLAQKDRVRAQLLEVFPGRKILILDAGFELAIVAPTAGGAAGFSTAFGDPSTGYPQAK